MKALINRTTDQLEIKNIIKAMVFHDGEPYATSTQIARYFGIKHKDVLRKIRSFHSFDALIDGAKLRRQIRTIRGKEYPYYELDADAFAFTCLSFTGKRAEAFKWAFIQAFKQATAEAIAQRARAEANLSNEQYFSRRQKSKKHHRGFTDAIKRLCQYAEEQRGRSYDGQCPYFKHFQLLAYQTIGKTVSKAHKPNKDTFTAEELEVLKTVEDYIANKIIKLIDFGLPYKMVYQSVKKEMERYKNGIQER